MSKLLPVSFPAFPSAISYVLDMLASPRSRYKTHPASVQSFLLPSMPFHLLFHPHTSPDCSCCCCSVAKSCPTVCSPTDCSTPGSSVLHCLLEFVRFVSMGSMMLSNRLIPTYDSSDPSEIAQHCTALPGPLGCVGCILFSKFVLDSGHPPHIFFLIVDAQCFRYAAKWCSYTFICVIFFFRFFSLFPYQIPATYLIRLLQDIEYSSLCCIPSFIFYIVVCIHHPHVYWECTAGQKCLKLIVIIIIIAIPNAVW